MICDVDFDVDSKIRIFTDAEQHPQAWSGVGGWTRWEWDRWIPLQRRSAATWDLQRRSELNWFWDLQRRSELNWSEWDRWNALQTSDVPPPEEEQFKYIYI